MSSTSGLDSAGGRMNNLPKDADRPERGPSLEGQRIDKYEILRLVGRGGMGAVYEALNTSINKRVAMKCIDASLARNEEANARFQREALAASSIESPHIVQIFDAGATSEGMPYIVMELLRGQDLGRCLVEVGRLEVAEALHVVVQVLRGLRRAHAEGIVHRDLKPDNVFLVEREDEPLVAKILDFGVSKINRAGAVPLETLTQQGSVVGTPYYMSPEQAQAFPDVDARADIYSVGAILYECLAGRPPHVGQAYEQVIVNICMKDAEDVRVHNEAVPEGIAGVLARALSRERDERYGSAQEMLEDLIDRAPPELRSEFRSASSGMRRIALGLAQGSTGSAAAADGEPLPGPNVEHESSATPASAPLADTMRAESGMMSVATSPSEPPELPMDSSGRRWAVTAVVAAGLAVGVGAVLVTSFGDPDRAPDESDGDRSVSSVAVAPTADHRSAAPTASVLADHSTSTGLGDANDGGASVAERASSAGPPAFGPPPPQQVRQVRPPVSPDTPTAPALPSMTGKTSPPSGLPLLEE